MSSFEGVAVVLGAGSGDGKAVVRQLVKAGCSKLILGDQCERKLKETIDWCLNLSNSKVDISSSVYGYGIPSDIDRLVEQGMQKFQSIDYCANCERIDGERGKTGDVASTAFLHAIETWQKTIWLAMRAVIRTVLAERTKRGGEGRGCSIVNIAAAQGVASDREFPGYCAAAHGIVGMTRATAMDYLGKGFRINCVCPGASENLRCLPSARDNATALAPSLPTSPSGKFVSSEEVASAVVFLLSDKASAITGVELPVDYGWSLYHH